ncbi:hypothetical protein AN958_10894 [Leucoagaricus sp. SymC.cos]|nr:hypothetical protein AN958_10894 [Leucoagaricus sp. SymC.cos]
MMSGGALWRASHLPRVRAQVVRNDPRLTSWPNRDSRDPRSWWLQWPRLPKGPVRQQRFQANSPPICNRNCQVLRPWEQNAADLDPKAVSYSPRFLFRFL